MNFMTFHSVGNKNSNCWRTHIFSEGWLKTTNQNLWLNQELGWFVWQPLVFLKSKIGGCNHQTCDGEMMLSYVFFRYDIFKRGSKSSSLAKQTSKGQCNACICFHSDWDMTLSSLDLSHPSAWTHSRRNRMAYPAWLCQNSYWKWPFIVDLPIENGGSFHSYVTNYQRVVEEYLHWHRAGQNAARRWLHSSAELEYQRGGISLCCCRSILNGRFICSHLPARL